MDPVSYAAAEAIVTNAISTGDALEAAAAQRKLTVEAMRHYLGPSRLGLDISGLRVLHVTGTKGKGSTCCFVESVLQHHGVYTGLFTSPHLLKMTERIRIDGRPISDEAFARYTCHVWDKLRDTAAAADATPHPPMPTFFRLLTLVGLWAFVHARVEIVVCEVGMGGRYDATNVVPPPIACGITTLDYDHCSVLGHTLPEIAWEKGGIFKRGSRCFSAEQASADALAMLQRSAEEAGEQLVVVPPLSGNVVLGLDGAVHQRLNAALALALCACVLETESAAELLASDKTKAALAAATWPGRCQTVQRRGGTFFLDGAHTEASIYTAAEWFMRECAAAAQRRQSAAACQQERHLIFNCSHERDAVGLLRPLLALRDGRDASRPYFAAVHFVKTDGRPSRMAMPTAEELVTKAGAPEVVEWRGDGAAAAQEQGWQATLATLWQSLQAHMSGGARAVRAVKVHCARQVARDLAAGSHSGQEVGQRDVMVLATGSLYVVAAVLEGIEWSAG